MKIKFYYGLMAVFFFSLSLSAQWSKDQTYVIRNVGSGQVLHAKDGDLKKQGCKMVMHMQNNSENQLWSVETLDSGKISIRNKKNKNALTLNRQKDKKSGEPVALFDWGGNDGQKWRFENVGHNEYVIRNIKNNFVLDANRNGQYNKSGEVVLTDSNGGEDQKWVIENVNMR